MAKFDGHVAENAKEAVKACFAVQEKLEDVLIYASLCREADNGDPEAQEQRCPV